MAINAYCGVMGSGKSYEVVSGPLLNAVASGRRVVTNIDGVNEDRIHEYLASNRGADLTKLGRIVHVTTDAVREPDFFPVEEESSDGAKVSPGFVQAGDLVVIDEAWKLWAAGEKIPKEHIAFFRMHRHFVHEQTGVACDVVMMVQDIGDLHRMLKPVVELSFRMVKLKAVGAPSAYRAEMYEGWKQNSKTRTGTFIRKYKKEIFPLYKSYAGAPGQGAEAVVDKRQNILANKMLWLMALGVVLCVVVGLWAVTRFFTKHNAKPLVQSAAVAHAASSGAAPAAASSSASASIPAPSPIKPPSDFSDTWRVAGRYSADGRDFVVLVDGAGRMRVDSPGSFSGVGAAVAGRVDGERVAIWTGAQRASASILPGSK
ncbi:zonular occludens toxin domain-containing protein [Caballeronia zhejiangensis]|uniref:zonular occludens toxin domain-containing protein n=1 Tax=Caballeronia zhejiangensis TaxID=871203 RepID=UPI00158D1F7A|nr:zonular occludens toxin domain-containing protein [Caballeronia zhejiangensis]MCI1042235.1 Zonular occludens toxin [Caballeronia zhejiangensis]